MPTWIIAITVIVVLQTTSAYLGRLCRSPPFMREFGWDEKLGRLSLRRQRHRRAVRPHRRHRHHSSGWAACWRCRSASCIGAASLVLYLVPSLAVALIASIIIGLNNGAANPAGSEVLQRFTPPAHRNFVFSIKQAGVPLGGVVAGSTSRRW